MSREISYNVIVEFCKKSILFIIRNLRKVILEADFLIISKSFFILKSICVNIYISNIFFIYLKIFKRNIYSGDLVMKLKMLGILCLYSIGTQCVLTREEAAVIYAWAQKMPKNDPLRLAIEAGLERENSSDSDSGRSSASTPPPLPLAKAYADVCRGGSGACVAEDDVVIVDVFQESPEKAHKPHKPHQPNSEKMMNKRRLKNLRQNGGVQQYRFVDDYDDFNFGM